MSTYTPAARLATMVALSGINRTSTYRGLTTVGRTCSPALAGHRSRRQWHIMTTARAAATAR